MKRAIFLITCLLLSLSSLIAKKNVAVSYFDNNGKDPEYDVLSKGIADMLITELSDARNIRVVERERLEELLNEIELNKSGYIDPETAQKLGKGLGADAILTGAFTILGEKMRIDARLIEVESGEVLLAEKVKGNKDAFFDLHKDLTQKLRRALNVKGNLADLAERNKKVGFGSVVKYSKAIDQKDNGLGEQARKTLKEAIEQAPSFELASTKLDSLEVWLEKLEKKRKKKLEEDLKKTLADLDTSSEKWGMRVTRIWSRLISSYEFSKMLEFNRILRNMGVPKDEPMYPGMKTTFGEMAGMYDCTALYNLKRFDEFIPRARNFLETYPSSMYFQSIKVQLKEAAREVEKRREGEDKAERAIASIDTAGMNRKRLLMEYANTYNEHHQFPEEIAVRWRLIENIPLEPKIQELQYYLLYNAYREIGSFNECRKIEELMQRKFPDGQYTATLSQTSDYLPK